MEKVAIIKNAPDGFVNIRDKGDLDGLILGKVDAYEKFYVTPDGNEWWLVRTSHGISGYMRSNRIRVLEVPE